MKCTGWAIWLIAVWAAGVSAQTGPSGPEVLRRVQETHQAIRDYTVDVNIHVQMERVKVPDVSLRVYHKFPDKTRLKPLKGFAILPKGALPTGDPLAQFAEHFTPKVVGKEALAGQPVIHLKLLPKEEISARPVEAWVDSKRWVVLKLRSISPAGDPLTVDIAYQRCQGRYWLPSRSAARLKAPDYTPPRDPRGRGAADAGKRRTGMVTATFANYRVNTGLPDSLFQEEQPKEFH